MQLKWEWAGFGGNDQTEGCGHGSPLVAMKLRAYEPVAYRTYIFTGSISEMEEFVKSNTVQSQKGQFGTYDLHEKILQDDHIESASGNKHGIAMVFTGTRHFKH